MTYSNYELSVSDYIESTPTKTILTSPSRIFDVVNTHQFTVGELVDIHKATTIIWLKYKK